MLRRDENAPHRSNKRSVGDTVECSHHPSPTVARFDPRSPETTMGAARVRTPAGVAHRLGRAAPGDGGAQQL